MPEETPVYRWHPRMISEIARRCSRSDLEKRIAELEPVVNRCHISRVQVNFLRRVQDALPNQMREPCPD